jgi:hypothetical protein
MTPIVWGGCEGRGGFAVKKITTLADVYLTLDKQGWTASAADRFVGTREEAEEAMKWAGAKMVFCPMKVVEV